MKIRVVIAAVLAAAAWAQTLRATSTHQLVLRGAALAAPQEFNSSLAPLTRVCGNYCGPGWCDGKSQEECARVSSDGATCEQRGCYEGGESDGSCADECCKRHDTCCGSSDRHACNKDIVACLGACPTGSGDKGCGWELGITVSPSVIEAAMDIVSSWCCGEQC